MKDKFNLIKINRILLLKQSKQNKYYIYEQMTPGIKINFDTKSYPSIFVWSKAEINSLKLYDHVTSIHSFLFMIIDLINGVTVSIS